MRESHTRVTHSVAKVREESGERREADPKEDTVAVVEIETGTELGSKQPSNLYASGPQSGVCNTNALFCR